MALTGTGGCAPTWPRVGQHADPETIRLLMRELALVPCQPGPWRPTTTVAGDVASTPDLLRRDFTCNTPATKLVGDITYIRTWEGWLYLATVLDCHTKQVLGYAMADHLRTALVTDALAMAARKVTIRAGVTVFHSDRGCQYTSQEFADTTDQLGLVRSLGRTGTCYDNAWAESFNGTLKNERVNRTVYPTKDHARIDISRYIELRYNQKRLHSALGYITPNEAEQNWFRDNRAAKKNPNRSTVRKTSGSSRLPGAPGACSTSTSGRATWKSSCAPYPSLSGARSTCETGACGSPRWYETCRQRRSPSPGRSILPSAPTYSALPRRLKSMGGRCQSRSRQRMARTADLRRSPISSLGAAASAILSGPWPSSSSGTPRCSHSCSSGRSTARAPASPGLVGYPPWVSSQPPAPTARTPPSSGRW